MRRSSLRLIFALASFVFWGAGMSWAAPGDLIGTLPDPTGIYDGFGVSIVPMDENRFWVGAHGLTDPDYPGAIFLFNTADDSHLIIDNPTGFIGENFGEFMVLAKDLLVVSARWAYELYQGNWYYGVGAIYVYKASTGEFVQKLTSPEPVSENSLGFGGDLAFNVQTDELFIAYHGAVQQIGRGAVYVYDVSPSGLTQKRKIDPPVPGSCTFASKIVLGGNKLLASHGTCDRARLMDSSTGSLIKTLQSPSLAQREFGYALAYANSVWAVGDPTDSQMGTGAVFIFDGETGNYLRSIHHPAPYGMARFGDLIIPYEDHLIIGARYEVQVFTTNGDHLLTIPTSPRYTLGMAATKSKLFLGSGSAVRIYEGIYTPEPTATSTLTPLATTTPSETPSITPSPSASETPTETPSISPSASASPTPTASISNTAPPTLTPSASASPSPEPTPPPDPSSIRNFLLGLQSSPHGWDVTADGSVDVADLIAAFSR